VVIDLAPSPDAAALTERTAVFIRDVVIGVDRDGPAVVLAVVDWEMATLGDPLADLDLHLVYSDPAFAPVLAGSAARGDGFDSAGEAVAPLAAAGLRALTHGLEGAPS
jgi:aminoglycoside phosphotransferase (APT) family kinase protein